ncbi:MAG: GDP-mannose 4,6-dehydratase [bacterium]|nr:GDP-mannose 4,6-dehydratase [bacterium]
MGKTALITGIAGQDGSYLSELLLEQGYRVVGMERLSPESYYENLEHLKPRVTLYSADLTDQLSLLNLLEETLPDEVYNLASYSYIPLSWDEPVMVGDLNGLGVARLLQAIRRVKPQARFYQASSSEIFGKPDDMPQTERTPFRPMTPYGTAKLYGHGIVGNYREQFGVYACSGILYNHESPRRGREFVTRKITHAVARIALGMQETLTLGDLRARRDWGYAKDYVRAMWLMLQQEQADDYVIASGVTHSVGECVEVAFAHVQLDWHAHVVSDPQLARRAELTRLVGDASKARKQLGWTPTVSFEELIRLMVDAELAALRKAG